MTDRQGATHFRYQAYGVAVTSDFPLALPGMVSTSLATVECRSAVEDRFADARTNAEYLDAFHKSAFLADGSTYLGWDTVGEFIVSPDGRQVDCRRADEATWGSFQVYMLGQALSAALVKQGIEPLHATTVVVDGEAIAFLGDSGHGKSSLAACFLHAGHRLLTDDLLVLEESARGLLAHPGPAQIKLFPGVARTYLRCCEPRMPMNSGTEKLILPLAAHERCAVPVPLVAFYAVTPPRDACRRPDVCVEALSRREGFLWLLRSTFDRRLVERSRLARQFAFMTALADRVAVRRLSYPRSIARLAEVRDAVLAATAAGYAALSIP